MLPAANLAEIITNIAALRPRGSFGQRPGAGEVMPKLQRAALVITLALLSTSPSFAQSGKAESIPANDRALAIVDASSLQEWQHPLTVAQAGDRFVLKDVRVIMQDTRYIEGWLSRQENNTYGGIFRFGQLLRAPTKDFEDLTLLAVC